MLYRIIAKLPFRSHVNLRSCEIFRSNAYNASISGIVECVWCTFPGSSVGTYLKSGTGSSSASIAEKKHAGLPLRSLVPPAISASSTIDL